jgi:hypothetical protein
MATLHLAALALALTASNAPVSAVAQEPPSEPGVPPPAVTEQQIGPPAPLAYDDKSLSQIEAFLGEGVVAVVGRQLIRRNDVVAAFESEAYDREIEGLAEARRSSDLKVRERGHVLVLVEMLRDHLKAEGGRNQGYAQEMIDAILAQRMADLQRSVGGAVAASQALRQSGYDPESYNERNEALLLRQTWQRSVTGLAPGPTGRPSVDRFVAPGLLQLEYRNRLESRSAEVRATLGEEPKRYALEQVILGFREYRSVERARDVAERIQAEVRAGTLTMEVAARQFTLPQNRISEWQVGPLSEAAVQAYSRGAFDGTALTEWVLAASPGDVSEPFTLKFPDEGVVKEAGLVVFRLAEILPARDAAPLGETALQVRLVNEIQDAWDDTRTERALVDLLEATYVWPLDLRASLLRGARRGGNGAPNGQGLR